MARPKKQGLDYFTNDVNFYQDIKIRKLIRHKGVQAVSVYHILLCQIYASGYYLSWDEDLPFIVSEISGLEEDTIQDIINYCITIGLFDKTVFDTHQVLTSHGIQERYISFCTVAKRKLPDNTPYLLVNLNPNQVNSDKKVVSSEQTLFNSEEINDNTEETPNNSEKSTQSKVKESKGDIDSSLRSESSSSATTNESSEINYLAFMDFFNRTMQENGAQIPTITDMTLKRRQAVHARAKEHSKEALCKAVLNAATAPFLNGAGDKAWVADFNWIFRPVNFVKVLEGTYNHAVVNRNAISNGTGNNNGYRTVEDLRSGAASIIARMEEEGRRSPK